MLGDSSFWSPYLKLLPQPNEPDKLGTPLFFSATDKLWLKGTNLEKGCSDREMEWIRQFDNAISHLKSEGFDVVGYTWELALWAATITSSRSFTSALLKDVIDEVEHSEPRGRLPHPDDTFPVLFPLVDLLNHQPKTEIQWTRSPKELALETVVELQPGQAIWNNYGPKSNEERMSTLLLGYGFCLSDNPFDQAAVKLSVPYTPRQLSIRRRQSSYHPQVPATDLTSKQSIQSEIFYIRHSIQHRADGDTSPYPELTPFPTALVDILSVLVANERETQLLEDEPDLIWKPSGSLRSQEPSITTLGPRHRCALANQLASELKRKMELISVHDKSLPAEPQNQRQQYAEIYRTSQYQILAGAYKGVVQVVANAVSSHRPFDGHLTVQKLLLQVFQINGQLVEDFKTGLEYLFGSCDISTLISAGWEYELWMLVVCYLSARRSEGAIHDGLESWIDRVRSYKDDVPGKDIQESYDELASLIESTTATAPSDYLFAQSGYSSSDLRWAAYVVKQEAEFFDPSMFSHLSNPETRWLMYVTTTQIGQEEASYQRGE